VNEIRYKSLDVVGLVPAAGRGNRIAPLPCSKELYPIGFRRDEQSGQQRVKVASHHLFEKMRKAGVTTAYVILRDGKWDIPAYFGDGKMIGMRLAYLVVNDSRGPPDTLDRAFSFVNNRLVAFGFPDILFDHDDVFERLLTRLAETNADAVLGLYPAHDCRVMDMVDIDSDGRVRSIVLKPPSTDLRYTWLCAVWTPLFTGFMHEFVASALTDEGRDRIAQRSMDAQGDLPVGAVIAAAIERGLRIESVAFPDGTYIDIGTPGDLVRAVTTLHSR
jgi:dTDP-glucose pyrophosphorylase